MHELGVTQSILEIALEHGQKASARKIRQIHLVMGELSGIVEESVQFHFDFVSKGTMAEGARLTFEKKPGRLRCPACGHEFPFEKDRWICPACQAPGPEIVSGREFFMESIEVD